MTRLSFARHACALAALTFLACGPTPVDDPDDLPSISGESPTRVADNVDVAITSPEISAEDLNDDDRPVWTYELSAVDASYIAPHFATAALPDAARIVVRSRDGQRAWTYSKTDVDRRLAVSDGFWGIHVWGTEAIIELYTPAPMPAGAVSIDEYAKGFLALAELDDTVDDIATICGANDGQNAICYASSEPAAYNKGRAVARLVIQGSFLCTGWLLGSDGHLVTNNHCIGSSSAASNTTFDFMAEGSSCSSNCRSAGACGGTVVAASSQFIKTNGTLDYTLVKLPTNPTGTYGYLQVRDDGAQVGERIYLPEHSAGWGKHLQMEQGGDLLTVTSTTASGGSTCGPNQVTYSSDTQGGSSGSPVLGYGDNLVVALHHCGTTTGCTGLGVRIQNVVDHMGSSLPPNAIGGGSTDPFCGDDTCNGSETCSSCEADCGPCTDPDPDPNPDSCIESDTCGAQAPGGCWCDDLCVQYGDCCSDGPCTAGPTCGDGTCSASEDCSTCEADCGPCAEPDPDSCVESDACGAQAPGGCWCDSLCVQYGDCCSDGPCQ
jgi:V8-like Glu-specific endopeptidase